MKTTHHLTVGILGLSLLGHLDAVQHTVLPYEKIQSYINQSQAGDTIVIRAGTYNEDLTINKQLHLREEEGGDVIITGKMTFENIPEKMLLRNFKVGYDSTKHITITNCPDFGIENIDASLGGNLVLTNSTVRARNCQFKGALKITNGANEVLASSFKLDSTINGGMSTISGCSFTKSVTCGANANVEIMRCNISKNLTHNGTNGDLTLLQSTITEKLTTNAARSWINYNTIRYMYGQGNLKIIGNKFDLRSGRAYGLEIQGGTTEAFIANNEIKGSRQPHSQGVNNTLIGIRLFGCQRADILNNKIHYWIGWNNYDLGANTNVGVMVEAACKNVFIAGNNIYDCGISPADGGHRCSVYAPFANTTLYHNRLANGIKGGVVAVGTSNSTTVDKGPPEPEYNDHDGTRNNIGINGGHYYDPNGKTTNKPIVLSGDLEPIHLKKGEVTTIRLTTRGGVPSLK